MGKIDSHRNTDVRSVLEPISGFAEVQGVSVLGVTHIPKSSHSSALKAFLGSVAFIAACRCALLVTDEPETDRRLFLSVKNSFGPLARGIGYRIMEKEICNMIHASHIAWSDEPVDLSADQALAAASAERKNPGGTKRAVEFLKELLADGPVDAKEAKAACEANGFSGGTLDRARGKAGVQSTHDGDFKGGWKWSLK
jgi:putative DNA primase/helicase